MVQGNTDDYVPFMVSTRGYGLFWDNYSPTLFEDKPEATTFKSDVGDCVDYYFMLGRSIDGSIACMRDLTGQSPMFPLWTYGFWQSKERYKSQSELVGVVKKYRELGVPLDGIIQDWQYWGNNYLWNAMDISVCREVLTNLIEASKTLGIEADNIPKWQAILDKLPPYLYEPDGTLKEWA